MQVVWQSPSGGMIFKDDLSNSLYQEFADNSTKFLIVQIERDLMTMFYFSKSSREDFVNVLIRLRIHNSFDNLNGLPYWTVFISAVE